MKRILSLSLVLVILLGMFPITIGAVDEIAYPVEGGNIYFNTQTGMITDADADITRAIIPAVIDGYNVTAIGDTAFYACGFLTEVEIPFGVLSIGECAFAESRSLSKVTIPNSVVTIGDRAFDECSGIQKITIPGSVRKLGIALFSGCTSLTEVILNDGVTYISNHAFQHCIALTSIKLPGTLTSIGEGAFYSCESLATIDLPGSLTFIGYQAFACCYALEEIVIPYGVTTLEPVLFDWCDKLTKIYISKNLKKIDHCVFYGRNNAKHIYYSGSEEQWNQIQVSYWDNEAILEMEIHYNSAMPLPKTGMAYTRTQTVTIDGKAVELQAYALKDENGYDTNYVKLRDIALLLNGTAAQFNVGWDGAVNIITNTAYTANGSEMSTPFDGDRSYELAFAETKINGVAIEATAILLKDDQGGGYTYYKLRDLGQALGFDVSWVQGTGITIDSNLPYTAD